VRIRAGINLASDLRHPEPNAVVGEHRERQAELTAVERTLRLADHDRVEPPIGSGDQLKQPRGLGPTFSGERAGECDVEELRDDHTTCGFDQLPGARELPCSGRLVVLLILSRAEAVRYARAEAARRTFGVGSDVIP
jgi:hypothetical protein